MDDPATVIAATEATEATAVTARADGASAIAA